MTTEPVARIEGIDEYGPSLEWTQHWVDVGVGAKLYTESQVQAMLTAAHKPLTDRQIGAVIDEVAITSRYGNHHFGRWMDFARAIEQAHGIKATNQESNK